MIPDYNHDGKTDKSDRELEEIFLEEDEKICREQGKHSSPKSDAWAVLIVVGIVVIGFLVFCVKFGIH